MWLCSVVDISINEDKEYLEFWYADAVYAIRSLDRMYEVEKIAFEDWSYENTKYNCIYVPKPTKKNQL